MAVLISSSGVAVENVFEEARRIVIAEYQKHNLLRVPSSYFRKRKHEALGIKFTQ